MYATKDEECIVGIEDIGVMCICVDTSYTVHPNMRSHTGRVISF